MWQRERSVRAQLVGVWRRKRLHRWRGWKRGEMQEFYLRAVYVPVSVREVYLQILGECSWSPSAWRCPLLDKGLNIRLSYTASSGSWSPLMNHYSPEALAWRFSSLPRVDRALITHIEYVGSCTDLLYSNYNRIWSEMWRWKRLQWRGSIRRGELHKHRPFETAPLPGVGETKLPCQQLLPWLDVQMRERKLPSRLVAMRCYRRLRGSFGRSRLRHYVTRNENYYSWTYYFEAEMWKKPVYLCAW